MSLPIWMAQRMERHGFPKKPVPDWRRLSYLDQSTPPKPHEMDKYEMRQSELRDVIRRDFAEKAAMGFTITFYDDVRYRYDHKFLKHLLEQYLIDSCSKVRGPPTRILLIPEISPTGNFHYHGLIQDVCKSRLSNIKKMLFKYIGRQCKIEYLMNYDKWVDYVTKDVSDKYSFKEELIIAIGIKTKFEEEISINEDPKDALNHAYNNQLTEEDHEEIVKIREDSTDNYL